MRTEKILSAHKIRLSAHKLQKRLELRRNSSEKPAHTMWTGFLRTYFFFYLNFCPNLLEFSKECCRHDQRQYSKDHDHFLKADCIQQESSQKQDNLKSYTVKHISEGEESSVKFLWHSCLENGGGSREETADGKPKNKESQDR